MSRGCTVIPTLRRKKEKWEQTPLFPYLLMASRANPSDPIYARMFISWQKINGSPKPRGCIDDGGGGAGAGVDCVAAEK
jgi:hypothetical protein